MTYYNIKTKTSDKCRVYPDNPDGIAPSITSIIGCLMKWGLVQWAADEAVKDLRQQAFDLVYCVYSDDGDKWKVEETLFEEARFAYKRISEDAADKGTDFHAIAEAYYKSFHDEQQGAELDRLLEEADEPTKRMFKSLKKWSEKNQIEPVDVEKIVHGDGYSGRRDLKAYRTDPKSKEKVLGIYDIKTGKGSYYPDWGLQLGAHWLADYRDLNQPKTEEIGIIKLNKETLKCNFSESSRGPKFTQHKERLAEAFIKLKDFYWLFNDLKTQFKEIENGRNNTSSQ